MSRRSSSRRTASAVTPSCALSWITTRSSRSSRSSATRSYTTPRQPGGPGPSWACGRWVQLPPGYLSSGAERKAMDVSEISGSPMSEPTVVVDDISVVYRTKNQTPGRTNSRTSVLKRLRTPRRGDSVVRTTALSRISFVANQGDSIGVIGRNGSGKSTLMKVLAGLIIPDSGTVYAASNPILLGVNAALISSISGAQNIRLGCLAMGMSHAQIDAKFDDIVEMSGLEHEIFHPMNSYSSGMGARLRFAIAAAVDPEILLVDEALNTGDAQFKERSKKRMEHVTSQAGTVFVVSHSLG